MGRSAAGVGGIKLKGGDSVIGVDIIKSGEKGKGESKNLLVVSEQGFAKQTPLKEYKVQSRGGQGVKTAKISSKTGNLVACKIIGEEKETIVLSAKGQIIKTKLADIRQSSRATSGVRVMRVKEGDKIVAITCL